PSRAPRTRVPGALLLCAPRAAGPPCHRALIPLLPPSRFRPSLLRFRILFRTAALSCHSLSSQPFLAIGRTITVPPVRLRSSG
ncbi:hypothetical protein, partial [uncultured Duncaniella sp.]